MTTKEFRYEFDISWNNIMSNQAPGLSPYEISVFLTQAQESICKGIYNGSLSNSFESTEEARSYLSVLVEHGYPAIIQHQDKYPHITKNTTLYNLNDVKDENNQELPKPWFITYEGVIFGQSDRCNKGDEGIVKPVTHDNFWETKRNPFRKDNERRVLRLTYQTEGNEIAELVSDYTIDKYFIRYVRKPRPIILEDLAQHELSIDGKTSNIDAGFIGDECCELNESLHRVILDTAVRLAQQAWVMTRTQTKE